MVIDLSLLNLWMEVDIRSVRFFLLIWNEGNYGKHIRSLFFYIGVCGGRLVIIGMVAGGRSSRPLGSPDPPLSELSFFFVFHLPEEIVVFNAKTSGQEIVECLYAGDVVFFFVFVK